MGIVITQEIFQSRFREKYGDEFIPISPYKGVNCHIRIRHKKCGYVFERLASSLNSKTTNLTLHCPKCEPLLSGTAVIPGIIDLSVNAPEICEYLVDPDDAHRYRKNSQSKTWFQCPVCHKQLFLTIANVCKNGKVICPSCNDGFSYPNKFMANLLSQLKEEFITEYRPKWIDPLRYDFYIPSRNLIIEMDGALGHGHKKDSDLKLLERDQYKDRIAAQHDLTVIRIDCCYTSNPYEYIRSQIILSPLNQILNFECVDWEKCHSASLTSKIYTLLRMIKENKNPGEIKQLLDIKDSCFNKYIRILRDIGQLSQIDIECYRQQWRESRPGHPGVIAHRRPVFCYETGEKFATAKEAERLYGVSGIGQSIKNKGTCGKMHWQYLDALPENFDFSNYQIPSKKKVYQSKNPPILQYTKQGEFVREYINLSEIKDVCGYAPANILRVCKHERKSAYGYIWRYKE